MGKTTSNAVMAKHHTNFLMPTSVCLLIFAAHVVAYGPRVTTSRDPPEEIGGVIQMRPRDFRRRGYIAGASPLKPHTIQKRASYFVAVAGDQTCTGTVCGCTCTSIGNEQCYSQAELDQAVANVGGCDVVMKAIGGDCSAAPAHAPADYNLGTCKKAGYGDGGQTFGSWGSWGSWESNPPPVRTMRSRSLSAPSEEALISLLHDSQPHLPGASCTEGQSTGCTPGCAAMGGVCKVVNGQCSCNIGASAQRVVESSAGATCPGGIIGLPDSQPCPAHYKDNGSRPRVCCPVALQHLVETSAGAACTEGQGTGCTPGCAKQGGVCKVVNGQCSCNIGASAQRFVQYHTRAGIPTSTPTTRRPSSEVCTEGQSTGCTPGCAAMGGVCKVVNGQCSCNIGASGQQIHLNQVRAESDAKDYKYNHCGDASKYDQSKGIKQPECERCNGDGISAFRCSAFTRWKECSDFGPGWDICSMENSAITCPDKPRCGYRIGSTGLKLGPH